MVKCKLEYYNGEQRMRYFAVKTLPVNIKSENNALMHRLSIYKDLYKTDPNQQEEISGHFGNTLGAAPVQQEDQMVDGFM
jgi:hypothetical protein